VLFSIVLGVALIGVDRKRGLLEGLASLEDALMRITSFVARLAPIGVFALTASAAGTMPFDQLERLQVFLASYALASLLLAFFILPGLVGVLTPLRWREVVPPFRDAVITAFATGNLLIVIPILSQRAQELARARSARPEEAGSAVEVIVPASFNFPSAGKLLTLTFLPFGAWFTGTSIPADEYPAFLVSGLFTFFGSTATAIPFLLDFLRIPADLFHIFLTVDVIASRFGVMLAAMNTVCLALLGAFAMSGGLRVPALRLMRFVGVSAAATIVLFLGLRLFYSEVLNLDAGTYRKFVEMGFAGEQPPARLVTEEPAVPEAPLEGSALARVSERGRLRVCYVRDSLPFAFVNAENRLVGFDAEMALRLARELGVQAEFVRVARERLAAHLVGGTCDLAMSGLAVTTDRARSLALSTPYLDNTLAFLVLDHRRQQFASLERLRAAEGLRIASPPAPYYAALLRERLPKAEVVVVDSIRPFFQQKGDFDALLYSAEAGSAWTLVYPAFSVVVPEPHRVKVPLAYAMAPGDPALAAFVDTWIDLKQNDGTIDALFQHWILGRTAATSQPRWSVLHDVLHWGARQPEATED